MEQALKEGRVKTINIANAPCSWGIIEDHRWPNTTPTQFLSQVAEAGYDGTELGPYGFLPTDAVELKELIDRHDLKINASWVPVSFHLDYRLDEDRERTLRHAELMAQVGISDAVLVFGGNVSPASRRHNIAGRVQPEHSLDDEGWQKFVSNAQTCAKTAYDATGLTAVFHPHGGTWIETPDEVRKLASMIDSQSLNICFDTGHLTFGGADAVELLREIVDVTRLVHFKDCDKEVLRRSQQEQWPYTKSVAKQVFCSMGKGSVDFQGVVDVLKNSDYTGWITVEQDIGPDGGTPFEDAKSALQTVFSPRKPR